MDTPGKLVREVRQRHSLTQVQLGRLMAMASNHIARLERGEVTPSDQFLAHLDLLDRYLAVDPAYKDRAIIEPVTEATEDEPKPKPRTPRKLHHSTSWSCYVNPA